MCKKCQDELERMSSYVGLLLSAIKCCNVFLDGSRRQQQGAWVKSVCSWLCWLAAPWQKVREDMVLSKSQVWFLRGSWQKNWKCQARWSAVRLLVGFCCYLFIFFDRKMKSSLLPGCSSFWWNFAILANWERVSLFASVSWFFYCYVGCSICVQKDRKILHKLCWTVQGMVARCGSICPFLPNFK